MEGQSEKVTVAKHLTYIEKVLHDLNERLLGIRSRLHAEPASGKALEAHPPSGVLLDRLAEISSELESAQAKANSIAEMLG